VALTGAARYFIIMSDVDDEPVPRLPRGKGLTLDKAMLMRIAFTVALLVMVAVITRPCAEATSKFVTGFGDEGSGSAGRAMPQPGTVDVPKTELRVEDYEYIHPNMTEAEQKAAIERARAKAAGSAAGSGSTAGSGSAATGSAAAGSAAAGSSSGSAAAGSSATP
jgi:hypothetical protein